MQNQPYAYKCIQMNNIPTVRHTLCYSCLTFQSSTKLYFSKYLNFIHRDSATVLSKF